MVTWQQAMQRGLLTGSVASVSSAITLGFSGRREGSTVAGPNNAPSQWIWGEPAAHRRRWSLRYTAVGYLIHHLSSYGWALLHEKYMAHRLGGAGWVRRITEGAATAALANFVDYRVARGRLQPGFDMQLSKSSLFLVYSAFALGLAAATQLRKH